MQFNELDYCDLKEYYNSQTKICLNSELFGNENCEHGSKVLMLNAEAFPFLVEIYDIEKTLHLINNYQKSESFKLWFWKVKHLLGEKVGRDPNFLDIGKWIGKGFFLKIVISILHYNFLFMERTVLKKVMDKQIRLLHDILDDNYFLSKNHKAIELINNGYTLLSEHTSLSYDFELFYLENIIK